MLFDTVFKNPKWKGKDNFPSSPEWKNEIEKWLKFIENKNQLRRFIPRLNASATQRSETLAEISSAFVMEIILGFPILEWEKKTVANRDVDFVVKKDNDLIYCEVKSPGWESELTNGEILGGRKTMPKHIDGETRTLGNIEAIRYSVEKAYAKYLPNCMNLLIINDDLFSNMLDNPRRLDIALKHPVQGCFINKDYENLGGILFINLAKIIGKIEYKRKFVENNNSIKPYFINVNPVT